MFIFQIYASQHKKSTKGKYLLDTQNGASFTIGEGYHLLNFDASLGEHQTGDSIAIESANISVDTNNIMNTPLQLLW